MSKWIYWYIGFNISNIQTEYVSVVENKTNSIGIQD